MLSHILHSWSTLDRVEKFIWILLLCGWCWIVIGLVGLVWWSHYSGAAGTSVSAQSSSQVHTQQTRSEKEIVVEVSGAVSQPGVYDFPQGSRLANVLAKAGYFSTQADYAHIVTELNQARIIEDGEKVYIPFYGEKISKENTVLQKVSINDASISQLEELPGIGPKRAEEIITARPYTSLSELVSKKVLTETQFAEIEQHIAI